MQVQGDILNCQETIYVKSYQCTTGYIEICTRCERNYILSDNFSKCSLSIDEHQTSQDSPYLSCSRINQRFLCQEADRCSVLLESTHYAAKINDDKCAIISDDLKTCVMPKFGYTYILPEKKYTTVDQSMCAVYNTQTQKCEKYYYRFLPVQGQDYSVFYQDFINFDRVLPNSHSKDIKCQAPYTFQPSDQKLYGCIIQQVQPQDNCLKFNEMNECDICKEQFAINSINGQCEPFPYTFKGCLIQQISGKSSKCLRCQAGYTFSFGVCLEVKNCLFFDRDYPQSCLVCKSPFYGPKCEQQRIIENCEVQSSRNGDCLKCDNIDFYYTDGNSCILRMNSFNCQDKNPIGDHCNSLTDQAGFYLNQGLSVYEYSQVVSAFKDQNSLILIKSPLFVENEQYFNSIKVMFAIQFYGKQSLLKPTPVEGCNKYSTGMDLCIECASGKYLQVRGDITQCIDGVPSRLEGCELEDQYLQCYLCKEFYIQDYTKRCQADTNRKCTYSYYDNKSNQFCLMCSNGYSLNYKTFQCEQQAQMCNIDPVKYYQNAQNIECSKGPQHMKTALIAGSDSPVCVENKNNCKTLFNGICLNCQKGFTYNTTTKSCIKSEANLINCKKTSDSIVCQECNNDYSLKDGKCISNCFDQQICQSACSNPCLTSNPSCRYCQEGYVNLNYACYFMCPSGKLTFQPSDCAGSPSCDPKCQQCATDNIKYCTSCSAPLILSNGDCVTSCPQGEYLDNTVGKCIKCTQQCQTCDSQNSCTSCSNGYQLTKDGNCCSQQCQDCSNTDPNICTACPQSQTLVGGNCISQLCKPGQYLNQLNQCTNCPSLCLTCSSADKCTSCVSSQTSIDTNCQCQDSQLLHANKCVKACPFGWIQDATARKCNRYCQDNQFMEYNQQSQNFQCSAVGDSSSNYCSQIIEQIPNLVYLKLKRVDIDDTNLFLNIGLNETPAPCFTYKLVGQPQYQVLLTSVQASQANQVQLEAKILKADLQKPENVKFDDKYFYLNFQIFYKDYLQYTVNVKLTRQYTLILANDIEYNGDKSDFDTICEECDVPVDKLITSSTSVQCDQSSNCQQGKISVKTNTQVTITQTITDSQYKDLKIFPHSLKIKVDSQSTNPTIMLIQKYSYDNSKPAQITYSFSSLGSVKGTLVVTSKVLTSRRILQQQGSLNGYKYGTQQFEFEVKDSNTENQEGFSKTSIILISCFSVFGIALLIIVTILIIRKKKKQSMRKIYPVQAIQQEQSVINNNQQQIEFNF
ncbi:hypothetical protein ABPG72_021716 [Tetrahymena utriculariae]